MLKSRLRIAAAVPALTALAAVGIWVVFGDRATTATDADAAASTVPAAQSGVVDTSEIRSPDNPGHDSANPATTTPLAGSDSEPNAEAEPNAGNITESATSNQQPQAVQPDTSNHHEPDTEPIQDGNLTPDTSDQQPPTTQPDTSDQQPPATQPDTSDQQPPATQPASTEATPQPGLDTIPVPVGEVRVEGEWNGLQVPDVGLADTKHIVYDQSEQRVWLFDTGGVVMDSYLVTGNANNPRPGRWEVYSKSPLAWAFTPGITMEHMVRFAKGVNGLNVGFHAIPVRADGTPIQTTDQLGQSLSAGCVRQPIDKAKQLYEWTPIGTPVVVLA